MVSENRRLREEMKEVVKSELAGFDSGPDAAATLKDDEAFQNIQQQLDLALQVHGLRVIPSGYHLCLNPSNVPREILSYILGLLLTSP